MSVLEIGLFGRFDARIEGKPVAGLEARKAQELLAYLLLQRNRVHARETLAELLWGQRAPAQSRKNLRQVLWQVQSALAVNGSAAPENSPVMVDGEWVSINQRCPMLLDVAEFEDAYSRAQGIQGSELDGERADALRRAVQLYRGPLLEGCYEDWCLFERERLQTIYLSMLDKLISCCEAHGEYDAGLAFGSQALRIDRARERTYRQMMRLYYLSGRRTESLREYEKCQMALAEELAVKPSQRTQALREQVRRDIIGATREYEDQTSGRIAPAESPAYPTEEPVDLGLLLHRLEEVQAILVDLQQELHRDLRAVRRALDISP